MSIDRKDRCKDMLRGTVLAMSTGTSIKQARNVAVSRLNEERACE